MAIRISSNLKLITSGQVPTTDELKVGELAFGTILADGKLHLYSNPGDTAGSNPAGSIVEVNSANDGKFSLYQNGVLVGNTFSANVGTDVIYSVEAPDWLAAVGAKGEIKNKPATFTPAAHTHSKADITDLVLDDLLDGLPVWDDTLYKLTFTTVSGDTLVIDIPIDEMIDDIEYDATTKEIVFIKKDGTEVRINVADLITEYTGSNGANIVVTINSGSIQAAIKVDSLTESLLAPALRTKINGKYEKPSTGIPFTDLAADVSTHMDATYLAIGGTAVNASKVNNHTVGTDVPVGAVFTDTVVDISGKEDKSNKNAANGYAGLGATSQIATAALPDHISGKKLTISSGDFTLVVDATAGTITGSDSAKNALLQFLGVVELAESARVDLLPGQFYLKTE